MNLNILFYVTGLVTGILFLFIFILKRRLKEKDALLSKKKEKIELKNQEIESLKKENAALSNFKKSRESKKRIAKFLTKGWHKLKDAKDPNRHQWNVTFELREIAVSEDDENKVKFEVADIYSENTLDSEKDIVDYKKWFVSNHGGGWIDTKGPNFEWITLLSKTEIREDKLNDLLS